MSYETEKTLSRAIAERRASPSFDESPIPDADLQKILQAGLQAPSGYNLQPWRFIVVRSPEQKKRLRSASFNQAKVEEASVMIVACGDADGGRAITRSQPSHHAWSKPDQRGHWLFGWPDSGLLVAPPL